MVKSLNIHNDNIIKMLKKFGYHKIIVQTNYFYSVFRCGMSFVRLPNGMIVYYTIKQMY